MERLKEAPMFVTWSESDCSSGLYTCPACHAEKEVWEFYDPLIRAWFPLTAESAECTCGAGMERKG